MVRQLAINEGSVLHLRSDAARLERDVFVYRSYIGVGNYSVVLDEVWTCPHGCSTAARLLVMFMALLSSIEEHPLGGREPMIVCVCVREPPTPLHTDQGEGRDARGAAGSQAAGNLPVQPSQQGRGSLHGRALAGGLCSG